MQNNDNGAREKENRLYKYDAINANTNSICHCLQKSINVKDIYFKNVF